MNNESKIREELKISAAFKPTDVDVIMVVHNQSELVSNAIRSLEESTSDYHLYLWDNCSDQQTVDVLASADLKGGKLIRSKENIGFLKPNNELAKLGNSPYIVLLNTDVYCLPGWLEPLIGCLQNYSEIGVTGYIGGCLNDEGVGSSPAWGYDVDYISGWCLAIRRSDYEKYGLFDEVNLKFAYCEDADFCFRLREVGLITYAFCLDLVWHKGHATSFSIDPNVLGDPFVKNHAYMRKKWQKYLGRSIK